MDTYVPLLAEEIQLSTTRFVLTQNHQNRVASTVVLRTTEIRRRGNEGEKSLQK